MEYGQYVGQYLSFDETLPVEGFTDIKVIGHVHERKIEEIGVYLERAKKIWKEVMK
jgi:hypothetical protein